MIKSKRSFDKMKKNNEHITCRSLHIITENMQLYQKSNQIYFRWVDFDLNLNDIENELV